MAQEDTGKIMSAYEQMLKSGSAFKKIDMQKIQNQQYAEAGGAPAMIETSNPLGAPVVESQLENDDTDFSAVDEAMQRRMNALREKMNPKPQQNIINESNEILKLKKRVKQLEEAVMLLMQTQEKLLG